MIIRTYFDGSIKLLGIPLGHLILEVALIMLIFLIWQIKQVRPKNSKLVLSENEKDQIIKNWSPKSLVPKNIETKNEKNDEICSKLDHYVFINNQKMLNLATPNFLNLVGNNEIEINCISCVKEYAVGTCGPRGFYGTTDIHLKLEKQLSHFFGVDEAIIYSYGLATISSVIPAFCKRQDIIFADEGLSYSSQLGIQASRSQVLWFKHNDMVDLENLIKKIADKQIKFPKKFKNVRQFIIIESIYTNYGDIVDLKKIVDIRNNHKIRVFLDESNSIGVLGHSGRGLTEFYNIDIHDIDLISLTFDNCFASSGGACIGTFEAIDHQRLSSLGYCFSASAPSFLCQAVCDGVQIIQTSPDLISNLNRNCKTFHESLIRKLPPGFILKSDENSPILHIRFEKEPIDIIEHQKQRQMIDKMIKDCQFRDILLTNPTYVYEKEHKCPAPSLRIFLNCALTSDEICHSVESICETLKNNKLGEWL